MVYPCGIFLFLPIFSGHNGIKRPPSGEYGNTFILWVRLAVIGQDQKP